MSEPRFALIALTIDGPDEQVLADFYAALTGSPVERIGPDGSTLSVRFDALRLVFRQVERYRAPTWPSDDVPMQMHFELEVDDLDLARARLVAAGATMPEFQPHRADGLLVLLDPAGHPLCLARPI